MHLSHTGPSELTIEMLRRGDYFWIEIKPEACCHVHQHQTRTCHR